MARPARVADPENACDVAVYCSVTYMSATQPSVALRPKGVLVCIVGYVHCHVVWRLPMRLTCAIQDAIAVHFLKAWRDQAAMLCRMPSGSYTVPPPRLWRPENRVLADQRSEAVNRVDGAGPGAAPVASREARLEGTRSPVPLIKLSLIHI